MSVILCLPNRSYYSYVQVCDLLRENQNLPNIEIMVSLPKSLTPRLIAQSIKETRASSITPSYR